MTSDECYRKRAPSCRIIPLPNSFIKLDSNREITGRINESQVILPTNRRINIGPKEQSFNNMSISNINIQKNLMEKKKTKQDHKELLEEIERGN